MAGTIDDTAMRELIWLGRAGRSTTPARSRAGVSGWRVSPGHFAERHGLIIIIALGESIVSIGIGVSGVDLGDGRDHGAILGVVIAACLWWTYFDVVAVVAEQTLRQATGIAQIRLARDSYSYLHLPMIAGIVLVALGIKKAIGHVEEPLKTVPASPCAPARRSTTSPTWPSAGATATRSRPGGSSWPHCCSPSPRGHRDVALVAVAGVAAAEVGLLLYEVIRFRDARASLYAKTPLKYALLMSESM